jgi:phage I-like protein
MFDDLFENDPKKHYPEWIRILPIGNVKFADRDDALEVDLDSVHIIAKAFTSRGIDLVIDYEYQNRPHPAAGWVTTLEARSDGLWGQVTWTRAAIDKIKYNQCRYVSPMLRLDPNTLKPVALLHLSLVNTPAIKI